MRIAEARSLTFAQKNAILQLWNSEYPASLKYDTIALLEDYLDHLGDKKHYLLMNDEGIMSGWAFTFTRDGEKWFAMILGRHAQKKGYGSKILDHIKQGETILNGWVMDHNNAVKSNGKSYISPMGFYLKNNFTVHPGTRIENEKLSAVKISWSK